MTKQELDELIEFIEVKHDIPPTNGKCKSRKVKKDRNMYNTFTLIAFDEGGVKGSPSNLRLVCNTEKGDKIAIWGDRKNRQNIDTVLDAGLPCKVSCKYREPKLDHAKQYGHTHWVKQDFPLRVLA